MEAGMFLTLLPAFKIIFLISGCLVQPGFEGLFLLHLVLSCSVGSLFLFFLFFNPEREWGRRINLGDRRGGRSALRSGGWGNWKGCVWEKNLFSRKKTNAESKGQTFFLLTFHFFLVFFSVSPFFKTCMCTGGVYMTAFVHIRTHVWAAYIYASKFLHRHKLILGIFLHHSLPLFAELRSLRHS